MCLPVATVVTTFVGGAAGTAATYADGYGFHLVRFSESLYLVTQVLDSNHANRTVALQNSFVVNMFSSLGSPMNVMRSNFRKQNHPAGTNAGFRSPESLAIDTSGNIFVANRLNQRIRKVAVIAGTESMQERHLPADCHKTYPCVAKARVRDHFLAWTPCVFIFVFVVFAVVMT